MEKEKHYVNLEVEKIAEEILESVEKLREKGYSKEDSFKAIEIATKLQFNDSFNLYVEE